MNSVDKQAEARRLAARVISKVIRAAGTRALLREVAVDMIDSWAVKGPVRKRLAAPARWAVSRVLSSGGPSESISGDAGSLLTELARGANARMATATGDPGPDRGESVHAFLRSTDFGEIREMMEGAGPHVVKAVETFNGELWKYPAKVGSLVAMVIPLVNTAVRALREASAPIEKAVGPDLLADILLSVVKGINGREAGLLACSLQEVLRRVHTGSLLLGKGGKPLFQIRLTDLLRDVLPELDPVLMKKALIALAEDREAVAKALADALSRNPEITLARLSSLGQVKSAKIRAQSSRLEPLGDLGGEALGSAVSESMSDFDTYEAAGLINALCRIANRVHSARPDIVSSLAGSITDSVDLDELRETARWLIPDLADAVRPLAREVLPVLAASLRELADDLGDRGAAGRTAAVIDLGEDAAMGGEA